MSYGQIYFDINEALERFWNFVYDKSNPEDCWLWSGALNTNGYGVFGFAKKVHLAHRWIYEQLKGKIPEGMMLCHKCDEPTCVNPNHMFIGTALDNARDAIAKGRRR